MLHYSIRQEEKFYFAMFTLILCLIGLFFSLYITPFLIWKLAYEVPVFVVEMIRYFHEEYLYTDGASRFTVGLFFYIPTIILGFITYVLSRKFEGKVYEEKPSMNTEAFKEQVREEKRRDWNESLGFGFKILSLLLLCILVFLLIHGILYLRS